MTTEVTQLNQMVASSAASSTTNKGKDGNWFEAMAEAWGEALDEQANRILEQSAAVGEGIDAPSQIAELTAESLRMGFISNSSHTSLTSVGSALETLARKQ